MREIIIDEHTGGGRLDKLLMKYLDLAPKGFIYKMLRKKNILLNGKRASGNELLKAGDSLRLYLSDETIENFRQKKEHADTGICAKDLISYEDEKIIVFNKPKGMLSQKADSSDISVNDILKSYLHDDHDDLGVFVPGISNRLDRNTSGIMIAGKDPASSREINRAIRNRDVLKLYLCVVKGKITEGGGLKGILEKDEASNKVHVSRIKDAPEVIIKGYVQMTYEPLSYNDNATLLLADLHTGKSHQIRAQMAFAGHPLAGDTKYGDRHFNRFYKDRYGISSQLLHAYMIIFNNMESNLSYLNGMKVKAEIPEDLKNVLKGEKLCLHGVQEALEALSLRH